MSDRKTILRKITKTINGSIDTLSNIERDPPIVTIANLERDGSLKIEGLEDVRKESLRIATVLNEYRRSYWKMELLIKQHFLDIMKKRGYLPGRSLEVESLKGALPEALIKGDDRIWVYSFDHYGKKISSQVGRSVEGMPKGNEMWKMLEGRFGSRIEALIKKANGILPDLFYLKARIRPMISDDNISLDNVKVKRPKVTKVERPIKKVIVVRRPIPIPKKVKKPRKRILKRPEMETIGPEDMR